MAKLPEGIFGPIIGKVGPIVGATWKGIPYVRSLAPKSVKPPTPAQFLNNEKFKFTNQFLKPFQPFFNIGFMNKAIKMTPLNVAYSMNYRYTVVGTYPNLYIDYSVFIWSAGMLSVLDEVHFSLEADQRLKVTWQDNHRLNASFDDQVMLLIYCPALKIADGFLSGVSRADMECSFSLDSLFSGYELFLYISVISLNRKKTANSQYLGSVQIP